MSDVEWRSVAVALPVPIEPGDAPKCQGATSLRLEAGPVVPHRIDPLSDDPTVVRRLLSDLVEHAARDDRSAGQAGEERRGEAELFAIAIACCREMLVRLSDHFSFQKIESERADKH